MKAIINGKIVTPEAVVEDLEGIIDAAPAAKIVESINAVA